MPPCAIWPWEQWLPRLCQANLASTLKQLLSLVPGPTSPLIPMAVLHMWYKTPFCRFRSCLGACVPPLCKRQARTEEFVGSRQVFREADLKRCSRKAGTCCQETLMTHNNVWNYGPWLETHSAHLYTHISLVKGGVSQPSF